MWIADNWKDYAVLDCGGGEKVERWGSQVLVRPDPQAIWPRAEGCRAWDKPNAIYHRSNAGGGKWEIRKLPAQWAIHYGDLTFQLKPMSFKHTGLFPEQAANWDFIDRMVRGAGRPVSVLNLFAYTGGATLAAANAGASVCHVDASKGMVQWARENRELSGIPETSVRWIIDDALKFVQREKRRGRTYDGLLMDPPSYGRGPGGEVWKLEDELYGLVEECAGVLSDRPLFFLINSYTTGLQPAVLDNMLRMTVSAQYGGRVNAQEVVLPVTAGGVLPCGASGRWQADD